MFVIVQLHHHGTAKAFINCINSMDQSSYATVNFGRDGTQCLPRTLGCALEKISVTLNMSPSIQSPAPSSKKFSWWKEKTFIIHATAISNRTLDMSAACWTPFPQTPPGRSYEPTPLLRANFLLSWKSLNTGTVLLSFRLWNTFIYS